MPPIEQKKEPSAPLISQAGAERLYWLRRQDELERALLGRRLLEETLDLVGPARVSAAVVEMLGDDVERDPLSSWAVAGRVADGVSAAENRQDVLDRSLTVLPRDLPEPRRPSAGAAARAARAPTA
jgi:hypothetical protein